MCLILFAYRTHPRYKLVIAANRDEFYSRPTAPADFWENNPQILGGRDLKAGGTWMGMNRSGKISMLTNYRDLSNIMPDAPSRGHLVADFLQNDESAPEYLKNLSKRGHLYNGFNIICGNVDALYYYGNYNKGFYQISPGFHGLSNALLNSQWPKVDKGLERLRKIVKADLPDPIRILEALYDDIKAPVDKLPDTGVGQDMESMLSPIFIKSPNYGSRCSTVVMVDQKNNVHYLERTYDVQDFNYKDREYHLQVPNL